MPLSVIDELFSIAEQRASSEEGQKQIESETMEDALVDGTVT